VRARLEEDRWWEWAERGMATPEHLLRAGRLPLPLRCDLRATAGELEAAARAQLEAHRRSYEAYHARHAAAGEPPLADWAKIVLVPGLGIVAAFKDKRNAEVAAVCYRATMQAIENAEALGGFEFLSEEEVFRFEHWALERRKVEEAIAKERASLLLPRHIVLVIGGGSGIGEAAAWRFAEEGAHVVVADLDETGARRVAEAVAGRYRGRAIAVAVDVREEASIARAVGAAVLEYGGLDCLFYTAGMAPRFAPLEELTREDLTSQFDVHAIGAVLAIREAARVMRRQGIGGAIVCSVSKAALAPGAHAAAYGASKAAVLQALRVAAVELGNDGIRVNAINADQVETPLFLRFAAARAKAQGRTLEEQLERYRSRNVLGASLIPARACAELAVLLASERFRYTTGDILTIDGGLPDAFPR
jgi:NAD(P)-dependent dehydrogenase (short-subunit alcohol dehydrogenase family)